MRFLIPATVLVISIIISPFAISALFMNLANANIARATLLPQDAPDRVAALADSAFNLQRARQFLELARVPLADSRLALARGESDRAATVLQASSLQSDFIAQFLWADAEWETRQPSDAFLHWRAAGAFVYFIQQAHRAQDRRAWAGQENFARIAAGIDSNSADAHFLLGDALSRQDVNNREALTELDRAKDLTQDKELLAAVLSRKAETLSAQGKLPEALDIFSQARAIAPMDARPRTGYALTQLQLRPDARTDSIALLTQAINDSPWYSAAYIALANLSEARADMTDAEQWLQSGLAKNPKDARLFFALGEFYARQKRYGEARSAFLFALQNESHADALISIARALQTLPAE